MINIYGMLDSYIQWTFISKDVRTILDAPKVSITIIIKTITGIIKDDADNVND